jgi:uncharacterized protein
MGCNTAIVLRKIPDPHQISGGKILDIIDKKQGAEERVTNVCEIMFDPVSDEVIDRVLKNSKTVAVVGMSGSPEKAGYRVGKYLSDAGYEVIPVNPKETEIAGLKAYPSLMDVPVKVDVVDIFRPPAEVPSIVEQAIEVGAKAVWMQEGIVNHEAADKAKDAGLDVVMDRCMKKEHTARNKR